MGDVTLLTTSAYEAQSYDAVLVRDDVAVCVRSDEGLVRLVPLDKVNYVDGDEDMLLTETEIPESFYGGAEYGFADVGEFPELEAHLADLAGETY